MEWSIATCALGGTLEEKLLAIAKAGFQAVEIFEEDLAGFPGSPRELRALTEDLGLRIVALQPLRDYEAMPEPHRTRNRDRAQRWFDLMAELKVELTYVCSNISPLALDDPERAAADLYQLAEEAGKRGLRVGYEALAWGRHVRDWPQAWDVVRRADHPRLGLVLDSFHCLVRQNPLEPIAQLPGEKIFLVQLSDAPNLLMDPLALSRHHRAMPGQGDWPMEDFLRQVLATGYRGPVSLEIFNEWFRTAPPEEVAQDGMRALKYLFDRLGLLLPPLPPGARVQGVGFVEMAAEEEDLEGLRELLHALGFRPEARHPALPLELHGAGPAKVLLLSPQPGEANPRELPAVRGVGLQVAQAASVAARARALGLSLLPRPAEKLGYPALQGVGHTRIYLADTPLLEGYGLSPLPKEEEACLLEIDHFTNVVPRWELYSWLLVYKALFGFLVDPTVEVFDPYGMFYSRSVRSPDGQVRIPLNTAEGLGTGVSRFLRSLGHAGIQHVAFRTENLLRFAQAARARGLSPLRIPTAYYRVLAARYGLRPEEAETLEAHRLLYERSPNGAEFLHLYTPTFRGRFFFEVVERRGGYDAYGATNTGVRLQAQAYALEG